MDHSNAAWGYEGNFTRAYRKPVPYTAYSVKGGVHGICTELKDMEPEKRRELIEYYLAKYAHVKGRIKPVSTFTKAYQDYKFEHTFGEW